MPESAIKMMNEEEDEAFQSIMQELSLTEELSTTAEDSSAELFVDCRHLSTLKSPKKGPKRQLICGDALFEVFKFLNVCELLALSSTSWVFCREYLRASSEVVGTIHKVRISFARKKEGVPQLSLRPRSSNKLLREIPVEFLVPPADIKCIEKLSFRVAEQEIIAEEIPKFVARVAPMLHKHLLFLEINHRPTEEYWTLLAGFGRFRCVTAKLCSSLLYTAGFQRFFQMPLICATPVLHLKFNINKSMPFTPLGGADARAVVEWLHSRVEDDNIATENDEDATETRSGYSVQPRLLMFSLNSITAKDVDSFRTLIMAIRYSIRHRFLKDVERRRSFVLAFADIACPRSLFINYSMGCDNVFNLEGLEISEKRISVEGGEEELISCVDEPERGWFCYKRQTASSRIEPSSASFCLRSKGPQAKFVYSYY